MDQLVVCPDKRATMALLLLGGGGSTALRRRVREAGSGRLLLERLLPVVPPALTARVEAEVARLRDAGARILAPGEPGFPAVLAGVPDPPLLLFAMGRTPPGRWGGSVAIVGTREPDLYGVQVARRFARGLAGAGLAIVSGGARGIDSVAHEATLDAGGFTVSVLGSGLGRPSPGSSRPVFERIVRDGGLLITEHLWSSPARPHHFPERNRLIAGLADVTLIIQAAARSGTLQTAMRARALGRPVLAVPGDVCYRTSSGTNGLLTRGEAMAAVHPSDVLRAMHDGDRPTRPCAWPPLSRRAPDLPPGWREDDAPTAALSQSPDPEDDPVEAELLRALGGGPLDVDTLVAMLGLCVSEVLVALSGLVLAGAVRRAGGNRYALAAGFDEGPRRA